MHASSLLAWDYNYMQQACSAEYSYIRTTTGVEKPILISSLIDYIYWGIVLLILANIYSIGN
jgi:hypothetical protein